jgi:hypothetical protein
MPSFIIVPIDLKETSMQLTGNAVRTGIEDRKPQVCGVVSRR